MGAAMRSAGGMLAGSALSQLQSWHACALRSPLSCAPDPDRSSHPVTLPHQMPPSLGAYHALSQRCGTVVRGGCPGAVLLALRPLRRRRCCCCCYCYCCSALSPPPPSTPSQSPHRGFPLLPRSCSLTTPSITARSLTSLP